MRPNGLTAVEILIVLAIISVSIVLALPELNQFQQKQQIKTELTPLIRAITTSRDQAIQFNRSVIICPSQDQRYCGGNWHDGFISFIDDDRSNQRNDYERILLTKGSYRDGDLVFWRAFRRRNFLEFTPLGFTAFQNGTFTYCPKEGIEYAEGLILNAQGRLRFTEDADGDGIDEGANKKPLRCD